MLDKDGIDRLTDIFHTTENEPAPKKTFPLFGIFIIVALCGVLIKVAFQFSYVKEAFKTAPQYAVGACVLGLLAYYAKDKLKR